ncbi:hypothetical protein ACFQ3L_06195 [Lacticaseibacillus jixianensis]|uniref:Glycosyltransferase family 4 protein n=1 Tax=Lacticaseibacillus jixianensis TaxID=2486012 RepID=A0ABW4B8X4_9LACO|nr:hypothetical protein [Lacticaseibacillus jixianensis]
MKILFVVGSCLQVNSSANLCHIAYINGAVQLGHEVDVLSMSNKGSIVDNSIKLPEVRNWFNYDPPSVNSNPITINAGAKKTASSKKISLVTLMKRTVLRFYGIYGRTASIWMRRASRFYNSESYDEIISLATPYFSHHLAQELLRKGNVHAEKWIQIWEDPWLGDLYSQSNESRQFKEEEKLLSGPDRIIYSSPLTLKYQKRAFPRFASKMEWHTLPYYYKEKDSVNDIPSQEIYGYFGDYYSFSRNLKPFMNALEASGESGNIIGNSDLALTSTDLIHVRPRISLAELSKVEDGTTVLVFLCNLHGGQIPGKIYQYSSTNKRILFILDGTAEEKKVLYKFFSKFNRYIFCDNNSDSILNAIHAIKNSEYNGISNKEVAAFSPANTMEDILGK